MTILKDHQFEILPSTDAADGFVFGIGAAVSVDNEGFDPGETGWIDQDSVNSRRGHAGFGRDVLGSKSWLWSSFVDAEDVEGAVETLEAFASAWRPETLVRESGALTALRYRVAGRDRRIFGRPRRFAAPPTNLILNGYVPVTHDFALVDSHTYDDVMSSALVPYASSSQGSGFRLPATFPVATRALEGAGSTQLSVGGTARAYPIVRFNGPWVNPVLRTDHWSLAWKGTIPSNDWVEIDARPWVMTVLNKSGASMVEGLDRRTWLEDLWFAANTRPQVAFSGIAPGGGATALIRWRNTWNSL